MTPKQRIEFAIRITPSMRATLNRVLRAALISGLCAIMLCSGAPHLSAQRRSAVRVPAGEARPAPGPTARKSEKENGKRQAASRLKARAQREHLTRQGTDKKGVTVGVPWTGELGVQKLTAQIMSEQASAPAKTGGPRLIPEHEIPGRNKRPQDPNSRPVASIPSLDTGRGVVPIAPDEDSVPTAPQTISLNFDTVTGPTETGAFPPDTMGSVGPTQFFLFVNGRLRTFNKATGAADGVVNADPDVFFASVMTPPPPPLAINFTSDPQIRYDRLTARWIMIIIDIPSANAIGDTPNRLLIAVSDAASAGVVSAGTVWTFYFVQQDTTGGIPSTGQFLDYPSLGVDANALYIGGDMFGAVSGTFVTTSAWVIRKTSILSGGPIVVTAFRSLIGVDGPLEPRGVDNYDPAATEGFFIGVSAAAFGRLNMRRIGTPGGTPTISADIPITVAATTTAIPVDHLGNTGGTNGRLDGIDDRLYAAHIRNGRLWTAHSFTTLNNGVASTNATNRRMSVRWYELIVPPTTGTPTINQSGTVFDAVGVTQAVARQFWFPSVMVSGQGHAAIGYSTAGTPFRADAATNGRLVGDALGTSGAVNIYTASTFGYNPPADPGGPSGRRWGDYSFTILDPLDDMTMWTVQEYCNGMNTYGARVAKLLAPPPVTPTTAAPPTVPVGVASTSVVITGTSVAGSGFYDPGPDLTPPALPFNHISATVTGGVTVNSVTFNTPTQVTLNISTVGATPGPQSVTITNPDGQSATGAGIITVFAPPAGLGQVLINEFRFRGPLSAADEFVELYNNTDTTLDISGYTLHALTGAGAQNIRHTVPGALGSSMTTIPGRGHYLIAGASYTLAAAAAADGGLILGIVDGSGIGFFAGATPTAANRIDSAGFDTRDALFFEGTAITPSGAGTGGIIVGGEYSFVRVVPTATRTPQDTGNNNADFIFVSTTGGTFSTRVSILGAPGPENLAGPVFKTLAQISDALLDPPLGAGGTPNRLRTQRASCPPASSPGVTCNNTHSNLGTIEIRRNFTNNTSGTVTRLRFRIVDITTLNNRLPGNADLRALTNSGNFMVTLSGGGGTVTVQNLTLEAPSDTVTNGGGMNSTIAAGTITPGSPLIPGASINVNFMFGVQLGGSFRVFVTVEALP